ncbi:carboxypeptidase inhibitor SmCI-like [Haliotis cracherodii]|uniref:carboxypeptidase inhibitor SmCI-like n=1 Tax=Haliotis cracherodii TaxID=6455 RepID=UPI0039E9339E
MKRGMANKVEHKETMEKTRSTGMVAVMMSKMMLVVALIITCAISHGHGVADTNETTSQRRATSMASAEVCQLTRELGPCRALMPRYFYNQATRRCQQFYYGGCQGNGNNFKTRGDCVATCRRRGVVNAYYSSAKLQARHPSSALQLLLSLPDRDGELVLQVPAEGYMQGATKKCSDGYVCSEVYGHARCAPDTSVYRLPKVSGNCKAYLPRYYYNCYSRRCESFIYGGCGGNGNNFKTLDECNRRCRIRYRGDAY